MRHVTSGCHGNFSLLLNWKIITLAKIPHNLSVLKLELPGGQPWHPDPVFGGEGHGWEWTRIQDGSKTCLWIFLNLIKTLFAVWPECISPPGIWSGCRGYVGSPVRWDRRTRGFRRRNAYGGLFRVEKRHWCFSLIKMYRACQHQAPCLSSGWVNFVFLYLEAALCYCDFPS